METEPLTNEEMGSLVTTATNRMPYTEEGMDTRREYILNLRWNATVEALKAEHEEVIEGIIEVQLATYERAEKAESENRQIREAARELLDYLQQRLATHVDRLADRCEALENALSGKEGAETP